ncbi:major facilitator superfamily domain-containing protein 6-A [Belonocnema kinseyi]|uniref:major facilitator superfamily domain-containing protein 6-A n=1 Tax=Belonocnema kinseyi TaxID=2817044 RepID=UPI00143D57BD|nr:major facilitator superfamily domain-containing protein 6-A [Belonocnema kinseyi]
MKINYSLLPIKAHYFCFMASFGPILPFLAVYGKQLGVSSIVMGSITSVLPILFLIAKPTIGFIVDYFRKRRKIIFVSLLIITNACFVLMYFLPSLPGPHLFKNDFQNVSISQILFCDFSKSIRSESCNKGKQTNCSWSCSDGTNFTSRVFFHSKFKAEFSRNSSCSLEILDNISSHTNLICNINCENFSTNCLYTSSTFWGFVLLLSIGNIGFNVANCISDAICFDVLGNGGEMGYGRQRVWGTIGFGITAFLAGYLIDLWSTDDDVKSYTPAFILVFIFCITDLVCCTKVELPVMPGTKHIVKDVYQLIRMKPIATFLCFATIAGILDSFIIYFLFWYLEDLASATGYMPQIKFIEGLVVAAETLGGEVIFFSFSGKILKKFGYGYTFTFCFACYALRLGLISLVPNPWWAILVEFFMQGPTYALCYTSIVAYASAISPPGTSATVQGIVAGMDDGFGFAIGSLISGILYKNFGGVITLRIFTLLAAFTSILYLIFYVTYLKFTIPETDTKKKVWQSPENAASTCVHANS